MSYDDRLYGASMDEERARRPPRTGQGNTSARWGKRARSCCHARPNAIPANQRGWRRWKTSRKFALVTNSEKSTPPRLYSGVSRLYSGANSGTPLRRSTRIACACLNLKPAAPSEALAVVFFVCLFRGLPAFRVISRRHFNFLFFR